MRTLAAQALRALTHLDPQFMASDALPFLLPLAFASDPITRHGAMSGISEIVLGLGQVGVQDYRYARMRILLTV